MDNATTISQADLTWLYIGPGQENLTHDGDRETAAEYAELYAADGALLVAMKRVPEMLFETGNMGPRWYPHHSELLSREAIAAVPTVATIDELDVGGLLDLELKSAS